MKPTNHHPQPAARDFTQPLAVRGSELAQAITEARAAGFHAHRMTVTDEVIYRLQFWRLDAPHAKRAGKALNPATE